MNFLIWGRNILSFWLSFNILPCLYCLREIYLGNNAPGLRYLYTIEEIQDLDINVLNTVNSIGVIANMAIISYCLIAIYNVISLANNKEPRSFLILLISILLIQLASYWSDTFLNGENLLVINISSLIFLAGVISIYLGFTTRKSPKTGL